MKYRDQQKGGNLFSFLDHQKEIAAKEIGICRLNQVIEWEMFREALEQILGFDKRDESKGGRPPFDPVFMFKVLVLQKYHNLSDEAAETQIGDRFSFMQFLGLQPGDDIPDQNTIWDFREALEKDGRDGTRRLFELFHGFLDSKGLVAREGSIVDASFVDAPRQRNTSEENKQIKNGERPEGFESDSAKGRQKDCDAKWTKKNNETHYGYKNHTNVDAKNKFVNDYETTSANVHDSQVFKDLVDERDNAVFADSAYLSQENERYLLEDCDCEEFIMLKGYRNHPLSEEDKKTNKLRSRIRVRVEHVFGRMAHMGLDVVRTIGKLRAHQHNGLGSLVYNMDRYAFLAR
jgi:transposase, IS5 family